MLLYTPKTVVVQADPIQSELERVVASKEFASSPRLIRFWRYCVEQSRAGRLGSLKESVIGVHVFDRPASYDPKADPIVRVHARRLREKLELFYGSEDAPEIVIQIPKGGYSARFEQVTPRGAATALLTVHMEAPREVAPEPAVVRLRSLRLAAWIGVSVLALLLAFVLWRPARRDGSQAGIQPLVSLPGSAGDPAWGPDGLSIAFTWDGGASGTSLVYVLKKGETAPAKLTAGNRPEFRPVW